MMILICIHVPFWHLPLLHRTTYNFLPDFLVCFSKQQVGKNFDFPVLTVASLKSGFLYET